MFSVPCKGTVMVCAAGLWFLSLTHHCGGTDAPSDTATGHSRTPRNPFLRPKSQTRACYCDNLMIVVLIYFVLCRCPQETGQQVLKRCQYINLTQIHIHVRIPYIRATTCLTENLHNTPHGYKVSDQTYAGASAICISNYQDTKRGYISHASPGPKDDIKFMRFD